VLHQGHLLLTGFVDQQLVVLNLDPETGKERWRQELPPGPIEPGSRLSHPATATPALDDLGSVSYFAPFGLVAHDDTGRELWRHPLPTPVTQHGASSSPVLAGNLVLQLVDQDVDSFLLALDRRSGELRWRTPRPTARRGFSTPLPWPTLQPRWAIVAGTLQLDAYHLADGAPAWNLAGLPNEMVSSPIAGPELLYVAGWTFGSGVPRMPAWESLITGDANGDALLARDEIPGGPGRQHFAYIDADRDERLSQEEYERIAHIFDASRNAALAIRPPSPETTDAVPSVVWEQTRGLPYVPTPLLYEGHLYLIRNGGIASCLDAVTGEYRYQEERLGAMGDYYASPIAAAGKVLAIAQPGTAVVYRAGGTLEVLARNTLGEEILATPALAGHTLYLRTLTTLYAFRER
jgi:outer membrane protein assembly factor BamB